MAGATAAVKSYLAVRGCSISSLLRHIAVKRPLVAAPSICFLNLSFTSMTTPRILASCFALISFPLNHERRAAGAFGQAERIYPFGQLLRHTLCFQRLSACP